jgi:hypothetical protein
MPDWHYSTKHNQPCRVLEEHSLWGQHICRIWLPEQEAVVCCPGPCQCTYALRRRRSIFYQRHCLYLHHLFDFMDEQEAQLTKNYMQRRQAGLKEQHEHFFICKWRELGTGEKWLIM